MKYISQIPQHNGAKSASFRLGIGIGAKIILPFFLLTLVTASVGTFVLTNLFTTSLQERINNQLIDAGRIVSERMVQFEEQRLQTLRAVAGTEGVAQAVADGDYDTLAALVPQLIANSNNHAVELINMDGLEIYGWQKPPQPRAAPVERAGANFSAIEDVSLVLQGYVDRAGDKRVFLSQTPDGLLLFTVGPLNLDDGQQVGVVLVGTDVSQMTFDLTMSAVAHVTLYDREGNVVETTLGGGRDASAANLQESPELYQQIVANLQTPPVVITDPENETPLREVNLLGQSYQLAFGDWRLRGQSFGMFSVALPRNFLVSTVINSRNLFLIIFSLTVVGVFSGGFIIARRITKPLHQLVHTATAVTEGDLEKRSGIAGADEIGQLALAFDTMTETLAKRNREILEKASELQAIVDSIADGVIVMNTSDEIITFNPAARQLLADMSHDFLQGPLRDLSASFTLNAGEVDATAMDTSLSTKHSPRRYQVGNRVLGALAAPVQTPGGEQIGTVVVLRDITREVEAENLKDAFITSISHELRTPLTVIKVYADLMKNATNGHLNEQHKQFIHNINKGSEQLERHINQLINISEIQAGTLNLNKREVNFVELVLDVSEKWRERLAENEISLAVKRPSTALPVCVDTAHLSWAIDNLISNAFNYTSPGGHVTMRVYSQEGVACLDVEDNGIGIAAADQPYLFDRFFRAHNNTNYEARGVGLGLYITRSIVELHAGRVSVKSESGVGSIFTLAIPLAEEAHEEPV